MQACIDVGVVAFFSTHKLAFMWVLLRFFSTHKLEFMWVLLCFCFCSVLAWPTPFRSMRAKAAKPVHGLAGWIMVARSGEESLGSAMTDVCCCGGVIVRSYVFWVVGIERHKLFYLCAVCLAAGQGPVSLPHL